MKKRVLSLLLVLLMVVSLVPMSALAATNGHTANEAIGWVQSQVGKALDYDGVYGAQCVDLIKYYYDYLGCASYARGNGSDYATNALPSGWTRLKGAQPRLGDILVYTGGYNNYGHVAIYESDYVSYHQNFNGKQYVVRATCKYNALNNPYWALSDRTSEDQRRYRRRHGKGRAQQILRKAMHICPARSISARQ